MILRLFTFLAIAVFVAIAIPASAQASFLAPRDCPARISPDDPIVTEFLGLPLDREYWLTSRGEWFKLPYGYLNPWPGPRVREPILRERAPGRTDTSELLKTAVSFAFWMPDLRWPERNRLSTPSYRPCEDGRQPPGEGEYIVRGVIEWPWLEGHKAAGFLLPEDRTANRIRYRGLRLSDAVEEFGLLRLGGGERFPRDEYVLLDDPNIQPDLQCYRTDGSVPNPLCIGHVWWPQERLGLWLAFSRYDLADWQKITASARTLAHRWRDAALNDPLLKAGLITTQMPEQKP